jgi:hypothetical protein
MAVNPAGINAMMLKIKTYTANRNTRKQQASVPVNTMSGD